MQDFEQEVHDIDRRVQSIEKDLAVIKDSQRKMEGMRKILWSLVILIIGQGLMGSLWLGKVSERLDSLPLNSQNVTTALTLIDHQQDDITTLQDEALRIRNKDDALENRISTLEELMIKRTQDRYYRADAVRDKEEMKKWAIIMMENALNNHHNNPYGPHAGESRHDDANN